MLTNEKVLEALKEVIDPEIHQNIVELGMVKDLELDNTKVSFTLALTQEGCPLKSDMKKMAIEALTKIGVTQVDIQFGKLSEEEIHKILPGKDSAPKVLPKGKINHIIAVGSGKGGVGKSTVVTNLSISLAKLGYKVGVLDADILGPNLPIMFGIDKMAYGDGSMLMPNTNHAVKVMSLGFLMEDKDSPVIWRGPIVSSAIQELFTLTKWDELDYLLIDLPPGTGDSMLTVGQSLPLSGSIVVTTPAKVSTSDATKFLKTFEKLNVPILGIVENMSFFIEPIGKMQYCIFGSGGGEEMSQILNVPLMGKVPIEVETGSCGNNGLPVSIQYPDSLSAKAFMQIAEQLSKLCPSSQ
jgi:ATP-binding protein involved in chromosome partitioning